MQGRMQSTLKKAVMGLVVATLTLGLVEVRYVLKDLRARAHGRDAGQHPVQQPGRGGLAISAGNANNFELASRKAVDGVVYNCFTEVTEWLKPSK